MSPSISTLNVGEADEKPHLLLVYIAIANRDGAVHRLADYVGWDPVLSY